MKRATTLPACTTVPDLVPWLRTVGGGFGSAVVVVRGVVVVLVELVVGLAVLVVTGCVVVVVGRAVVVVVVGPPTE